MTTPLSNSKIREKIEHIQGNCYGNHKCWFSDMDKKLKEQFDDRDTAESVLCIEQTNALLQLIEQVCNESRIDELKQLWNYTQSEIVPEGAKPNDMSDRLHERIQTLTKESES